MAAFYITRHVLSGKGRIPVEYGEVVRDRYANTSLPDAPYHHGFYVLGQDAFNDREDALKNAEAKRVKKIASLKKQIAKLEAMTFTTEVA